MHWKQILYTSLASDFVLAQLRARSATAGIVVLAYHELADDATDIDAWTVVRRSDFLRQLDYLARHYDIVSLDQAIGQIAVPNTTGRPKVVITFDDGAAGNASILLPIVEQQRVPVTIYIATRQIADRTPYWFDQLINALQVDRVVEVDLEQYRLGRYRISRERGAKNWSEIERLLEALKTLDPESRAHALKAVVVTLPGEKDRRQNSRIEPMTVADIKTLAANPLVTLGSHSHCHNLLTQLSPSAVRDSIDESKILLERWSGRRMEHFAYPNGSYNDATIEIVQTSGFRSAATFEPRRWRRDDSLYRIPRIGVGRYDSLDQFKLNLVGGLRWVWHSAA